MHKLKWFILVVVILILVSVVVAQKSIKMLKPGAQDLKAYPLPALKACKNSKETLENLYNSANLIWEKERC